MHLRSLTTFFCIFCLRIHFRLLFIGIFSSCQNSFQRIQFSTVFASNVTFSFIYDIALSHEGLELGLARVLKLRANLGLIKGRV